MPYVSRKSRRPRRSTGRKSTRKSYSKKKKSYSSSKRNGTSGNTVTPQRDMRMQYSYRKMPYAKKKNWIQFVQKVKAVQATSRGLQRVIVNDSIVTTWTENLVDGTRRQGVSEVNLYSVNGTAQGARDKDIILDSSSNWHTTQAYSGITVGMEKPVLSNVEESRKNVPMKMAMIDITYNNAGPYAIELDLYVIKHRKCSVTPKIVPCESLIGAQLDYNDFDADRLYFPGAVGEVAQPGSNPSLVMRGVTPFMCPGISKFTGGTVVNKTKLFLRPGSSVTRSFSDTKHFIIRSHDGANELRYDQDTITYLAIAKAPGNLTESTANTLVTSWTKTYCWTQEGVTQPRATYFSSS